MQRSSWIHWTQQEANPSSSCVDAVLKLGDGREPIGRVDRALEVEQVLPEPSANGALRAQDTSSLPQPHPGRSAAQLPQMRIFQPSHDRERE